MYFPSVVWRCVKAVCVNERLKLHSPVTFWLAPSCSISWRIYSRFTWHERTCHPLLIPAAVQSHSPPRLESGVGSPPRRQTLSLIVACTLGWMETLPGQHRRLGQGCTFCNWSHLKRERRLSWQTAPIDRNCLVYEGMINSLRESSITRMVVNCLLNTSRRRWVWIFCYYYYYFFNYYSEQTQMGVYLVLNRIYWK